MYRIARKTSNLEGGVQLPVGVPKMEYKDVFDLRVKVINKKTGEVTILPPDLVEKAMEEAKKKWIEGLMFGYEIQEDKYTIINGRKVLK